MLSFDQIKFNYFVKKVRKTDDYEAVVEYVQKHKNLSSERLFHLTYLICESKEACYLLEFTKASGIKNVHCLNTIARALRETDSTHYINLFINLFPNVKANTVLIDRLCELRSVNKLLCGYIDSDAEYITEGNKRNIISTIIEYGSIEQIGKLANHYDILTPEERKKIICKVCDSLEGHYICLVAVLFDGEDKTPFVDAICKTNDAEMMYCFLSSNKLNDKQQIEKIVTAICNINNIEYVYRSLLLLGNTYSSLRKMLLEKIKESDNPKYMMLTAVYSDKDYLIRRFNFVQKLYSQAIISEGIFTDRELVDMYKYMQEVKSESTQLIKQKRNSK